MRRSAKAKLLGAFFLFATALVPSAAILLPGTALAQCAVTDPAGSDTYVCTTDAGPLTDTQGDNSLTLPSPGAGTVTGDVTFGAGVDSVDIQAGAITGNLQQGSGIDDFLMSGGSLGSLNQGDGLDTFDMSGGHIIGGFDDGDIAYMSGGRIGRVNMKLDNNLFDMSGGTIDANLVTGFGNDRVYLRDGMIGGNISVSGGTDLVEITGGTVGGEIRMSVGEDSFTWAGGGIVYGTVDLGADNDIATLRYLTNANIGAVPVLTGGLGTDELTFDNVTTGNVARFTSWEAIELTDDTELTFDTTLVLGDAGTNTDMLSVDASSTIFGGGANGGIAAMLGAVQVTNAGRIDLTNGSASTGDTFTIQGNYQGDGGLLLLNSVLGTDGSPSDRLIIDGGVASGTTGIGIVNVGGSGANTTQSGILVVEAINGGSTESGAFALANRVAAGAFEYYLFDGGVEAGTEDNWYLRSTLVTPPPAGPPLTPAPAPDPLVPVDELEPEEPEASAPSPPPQPDPPPPPPLDEGDADTPPVDDNSPLPVDPPEAPPAPPPAAEPDAPPLPPEVPDTTPPLPGFTDAPSPGATAVIGNAVPLYRVEVPTYAAAAPAAQHLAVTALGTFHERRGQQGLLDNGDGLGNSWGRLFGQSAQMSWDGTVAPGFDGYLLGLQAGQDLFTLDSADGHSDRAGLFVGHTALSGDVTGQALGWNDLAVGEIELSATSLGAYWTHIGPTGWYVDAVLMGSWFNGGATSYADTGIGLSGLGLTASIEAGVPMALGGNWVLEPQGQVIWQGIGFDDTVDQFADISFDLDPTLTGRIGFQLEGAFETEAGVIRPYLKANLWHDMASRQTVNFDTDAITTLLGGTSVEFGGGFVGELNDSVSLFATGDYTIGLGGTDRHVFEANAGLTVRW